MEEGDGWVVEVGDGAGWVAGGGLYLPIRLFGASMIQRSASDRSRQAYRPKTCLTNTGEYQTHTSHLVPSMGLNVLVVTLHGLQNLL